MVDAFMDAMPGNPFSADAVFRSTDLSKDAQVHLQKVMMLLVGASLCTAAGVMFAMEVFHVPHFFAFLASLALLMMIQTDPNKNHPDNQPRRVGLLFAFAFAQGLGLSDLVAFALMLDPSLVLVASVGTALIFLSFAGAAMFAKRRSYLYLGGMLSSALSIMFWLSIANMFFRSAMIFDLQLYGGLAVMIGFVMFDTQLIIERVSAGGVGMVKDNDAAGHALSLLTDVIGIFVRVLVILMKQQERQIQRKRRR